MTWARLDDGFWRNEKVIACSDAALGLHVRAISYCADQRTDGAISRAAITVLRAKAARIQDLVEAGLWDQSEDGYAVHDFLKYNLSAADADSKRQSKAIAGAKGAASRWHGGENAPDPYPTRTHPDPDPDPDPNTSTAARARLARDFYEAVTKRKPENAVMEQVLNDIDFAHGEACVAWAFESAAGKEEPWPYTKRILDKCVTEGHGPRANQQQKRRTNGTSRNVSGQPADGWHR